MQNGHADENLLPYLLTDENWENTLTANKHQAVRKTGNSHSYSTDW
jgi:hypothetical protein